MNVISLTVVGMTSQNRAPAARRGRRVLPVILGAAVAAVVPVTMASASPGDGSGLPSFRRSSTFTVAWKLDGPLHTTDLAPKGTSSGDTLEAAYLLTGKRSGTADYTCTAVGRHYLCSGVVRLPGGDVYVEVGPAEETQPAAVVGGTRAYEGVRGQFTQKENEDGTGSWTFRLHR